MIKQCPRYVVKIDNRKEEHYDNKCYLTNIVLNLFDPAAYNRPKSNISLSPLLPSVSVTRRVYCTPAKGARRRRRCVWATNTGPRAGQVARQVARQVTRQVTRTRVLTSPIKPILKTATSPRIHKRVSFSDTNRLAHSPPPQKPDPDL
jgi:hypothetical protein